MRETSKRCWCIDCGAPLPYAGTGRPSLRCPLHRREHHAEQMRRVRAEDDGRIPGVKPDAEVSKILAGLGI